MRKITDRVFARYGIDAVLNPSQEAADCKVFFWSVNSKSWQNMQSRYGVLGKAPSGRYVCLLPAETSVKEGDFVAVNGYVYQICRVEDYLDAKGLVCRWALCDMRGSEDNWR